MTLSAVVSIKRLVLLLAAMGALLVASAASAPQAKALEVGVNDDALFLYDIYRPWGYTRTRGLEQSKALGASWLRVNFYWADYARGQFKFLDALVNEARRYAINVHVTISGTSKLDKRGNKKIGYRRVNPKLFASFVKMTVRHMKGRVFRYSFVNEPQMPYFNADGPAKYCALYKAGRAAAKKVDGRVKTLWGELAPRRNPIGFMAKAACRGTRTDGFSWHPYDFYTEPGARSRSGLVGLSSLSAIRKAARRYLHTSRIYGTEFGFIGRGVLHQPDKGPRGRSAWTVKGYQYAKRNGMKNLTYYILVHPPASMKVGFDSGIVNLNSSPTPVYCALRKYLRGVGC